MFSKIEIIDIYTDRWDEEHIIFLKTSRFGKETKKFHITKCHSIWWIDKKHSTDGKTKIYSTMGLGPTLSRKREEFLKQKDATRIVLKALINHGEIR